MSSLKEEIIKSPTSNTLLPVTSDQTDEEFINCKRKLDSDDSKSSQVENQLKKKRNENESSASYIDSLIKTPENCNIYTSKRPILNTNLSTDKLTYSKSRLEFHNDKLSEIQNQFKKQINEDESASFIDSFNEMSEDSNIYTSKIPIFNTSLATDNLTCPERKLDDDVHNLTENKESKQKKSLKDLLPPIDYDSDSYNNSDDYNPELKNFTSWTKTVENQTMNMFHLCYGVSILKSEWHDAKKKKQSMFIRALADALWGSTLGNRAFQVKKVSSSKCDNTKVEAFTPKKLAVVQKTYHYYLKVNGYVTKEKLMSMTMKEKVHILSEWRVFLKSKVNTVRSTDPKKKGTINDKEKDSFADDFELDF